jgi:diguanylate cyclase (GGDEF)-like protein/PAS domain S-box-containing protein
MTAPGGAPGHEKLRGDLLAGAVGGVTVAAVVVLGISDDGSLVPVTAVVVGPLLAGILGRPRITAFVGVFALAAAVWLSAVDELTLGEELPRLVVIAAGAGVAVVLASIREKRLADLDAAERAHQADLRAMFASSTVGMMLVDLSGIVAEVNDAMCALVGVERPALVGHEAGARVHPDDRRPAERALLLTGEVDHWEGDLRLLHSDGGWRWVRMAAALLHHGDGSPSACLLQLIDITADKAAEVELSSIIASLREAVLVYDPDGVVRALNPAARDLYGLPDAQVVVGETLPDAVFDRIIDEDGAVVPAGRRALERAVAGELMHDEVRGYEHPDGRCRWFSVSTDRFELRGQQQILVSMIDITDRYREGRHLRHQVRQDPLTGAGNRVALMDRLNDAVRGVEGGLAVAFLDLDHFKAINDDAGHDVGDQLLCHVATRLQAAVRPEDSVCRYGGDEFVVVCGGCTAVSDAEVLADRLRASLSEPAVTRAGVVRVHGSIGVAFTPLPTSTAPEDLLRCADQALYAAKAAGRDRSVVRPA